MCGINGCNFEDEELIKAMNEAIKHRGPDGKGMFIDKGVSLGHVRLAIIDLSDTGAQPMHYKKATITFNGEIYNYLELRETLKEKGYSFASTSDTEVILAAYHEWGYDCVKRFNGMWSFCIFDQEKDVFFLSRDRFGQKPLYYYHKNGEFVFSSEMKGLYEHKKAQMTKKENIDKESVGLYFSTGYIPAPNTIFRDVFKLEARHNLVFDLSKKKIARKWQYYHLPAYKPKQDKEKLTRQGAKLISNATKLRMRSDVEVGAFLSGGLDSTAIVGEMKSLTDLSKLHTFSIGFKGAGDETKYMDIVRKAFKTKNSHEYFLDEEFDGYLDTYAWMYDEPFADYSGFPTHKVSSLAKKDHIKVVLSGDGGDEVFGGYNSHLAGARLDLLKRTPKLLRKTITKLPAKKNLSSFTSLYLLKEACLVLDDKEEHFFANVLREDTYKSESFVTWTKEKLRYCFDRSGGSYAEALRTYDALFNTLPEKMLMKVDKASMANSIEVRSPFMDYRLFEYAQTIPTKWKVNGSSTKILMREIIRPIVPEAILKRKKTGFTPPFEKYVSKKSNIDRMKKSLKRFEKEEAVGKDIIAFYEKIIDSKNKLHMDYKIRLFLFQLWYEKWAN